MAPEYIRGSIDVRADLFAVGVVAHELLTTRPLFAVRDDRATLQRVLAKPIEPPSRFNPAIPSDIDEIIMTALARDPLRRWQNATALRRALETVIHRLELDTPIASVAETIHHLGDPPTALARLEDSDDRETSELDQESTLARPSLRTRSS
jgi:serine/threonine-protein kinase